MNTIKMIVVVVLLALATTATALCEDKLPLWKGELSPIISVKARMLGGDEGEFFRFKKPIRYDYSYRKKGVVHKVWTVFEATWEPIRVGEFYGWVPANEAVRKDHPGQDHYVPVVVRKDCTIRAQVDWSGPSKEIP